MAKLIFILCALASQALSGFITRDAPGRGALTILAHNDFQNTPLKGSGAILIDRAQSYSSAVDSCGDLSETPWAALVDESYDSLVLSLAYQVYQGKHNASSQFWIQKADAADCKCRTIDAKGSLRQVKCSEKLPVLCSQSAPVSNATFEDTSPEFRITQEVGAAQFTGYRDFFTWKFRGVRFAPTPERFESSTTLRNSSGQITALEAGPDCLQPNNPNSSEDCLFLNIWTPWLPSTRPSTKAELKPVLFYIYGGNFVDGSGKNPRLDLTNFASRGDVVTVSINHRAGNFGMLVFNDGVHTGNLALNDQISALKWVSENIAAFGGDPDRITISGESSGAVSVRMLMTTPAAKGLFSAALQQSDAEGGLVQELGTWRSPFESYYFFTSNISSHFGCDKAASELECLRDVDAQELANLNLDYQIAKWPVVDNKYIFTDSLPLDGSGPLYAKDVPLLTGVTRDEAGLLSTSYLAGIPWPYVTYDAWMVLLEENKGFFKLDPQTIAENLPLFNIGPKSTGAELYNATINILTLTMYTCLDRAKAYSGAKNNVFRDVYSFNFHRTYSPPPNDNPTCSAPKSEEHPFGDPDAPYYRCHGGSQVTMFGNYARMGMADRDGLDQDFSRLVVDQFASFVRTGDPNVDTAFLTARGYESTLHQLDKVGRWEVVDAAAPKWRKLEWDSSMAPFGEEELCAVLGQPLDYWES